MAADAWQRVADLVRRRREDRHMSQLELAQQVGTTDRLIRSVEKAERATIHPATLRSISHALGWTSDSIERVLAGGEPEDAPQEPVAEALADINRRLDVIELMLGIARRGRSQRAGEALDAPPDMSDPDEAQLVKLWNVDDPTADPQFREYLIALRILKRDEDVRNVS